MLAEISILDSLPNGGAVVAIVVVLILFLKKLEKSEEAMKMIVDSFMAETQAARKDYCQQISDLMKQGLEAHKETRDAIRQSSPSKPKS